jgi:ribA/ribD-fused uncharacterized protein
MAIRKFTGMYEALSNFFECIVQMDGVLYPSVEHAYQAAKTLNKEERIPFQNCTSRESKAMGKTLDLRADWINYKYRVMEDLLRQKFSDLNPELMRLLLDTRGNELVEGNYWHDNIWGSCTCSKCKDTGDNALGKLLMKIRQELLTDDVIDSLLRARTIGFVGSRMCTEAQLKRLGGVAGWVACTGRMGVSGGCEGADQRAADKFVQYGVQSEFHVHMPWKQYCSKHMVPDGCTYDVWDQLPQEVREDALWLASQANDFMTNKYPKLFGRNALIVMQSDVLVYAINGDSTGTNHDVAIAKDIGVPVINVCDADEWEFVSEFLRWEKSIMDEEARDRERLEMEED